MAKPAFFWGCGLLKGSRIGYCFTATDTRSILRSCFVAQSAHPPAATACFTVLCGQIPVEFSPSSEAFLLSDRVQCLPAHLAQLLLGVKVRDCPSGEEADWCCCSPPKYCQSGGTRPSLEWVRNLYYEHLPSGFSPSVLCISFVFTLQHNLFPLLV